MCGVLLFIHHYSYNNKFFLICQAYMPCILGSLDVMFLVALGLLKGLFAFCLLIALCDSATLNIFLTIAKSLKFITPPFVRCVSSAIAYFHPIG